MTDTTAPQTGASTHLLHSSGTRDPGRPGDIAYIEDQHSAWRMWHDRRRDIIEITYRSNPHLKPSDIAAVVGQCEWLTTIPSETFEQALREAVALDEAWGTSSSEAVL